jgi:phytoene dehydrogenase-like protein
MAPDRPLTWTRREAAAALAAPALAGLSCKAPRPVEGAFVFESWERGHWLRDRVRFDPPRRVVKSPVVIAGGGLAGLFAAWWLDRAGCRDFAVLEFEDHAGGNSRWGENQVSPYPWAAHYLPVPGPRDDLVREVCREFGLLDAQGQWDERHLCHSPRERLFIHGRWQEGIEPLAGIAPGGLAQYRRFEELIARFRETGAFRVPMEAGLERTTPEVRELDTLTAGQWMRREGLHDPYLRWLAGYSTRDDYGTAASRVSAWAAVHYFAARAPEEPGPLTWPEGNGFFTRKLLERLARYVRTGAPVHRIARHGAGWQVFAGGTRYDAGSVIYAAPSYLAAWIVDPPPPRWPMDTSPWLVANLTLDEWPRENGGEPAWDNVIYGSPSLGYVVATHQRLGRRPDRTVWTYYWALAEGAPRDMRAVLLGGDHPWWCERILADLERAHPDIRRCVSRIDILRLGHAMPSPTPGTIFHPERIRRARPEGTLVYANSDLSGLSLFEEALHHGVKAARHVLALNRL